MMRCMVDYSTKMEKILKELHVLLQPTGTGIDPSPRAKYGPSSYP